MPGRNLRSSRKAKDLNKDWNKLNEGSPLPPEEDNMALLPKKLNKQKKKAAWEGTMKLNKDVGERRKEKKMMLICVKAAAAQV